MSKQIATDSVPCSICRYPIKAPTYIRQQEKCPYCNSINEAITQVATSTTALIAIACFAAGVFVGPALLLGAKAGQESLERKARARFGK
jgi:phage FluMu protein Com